MAVYGRVRMDKVELNASHRSVGLDGRVGVLSLSLSVCLSLHLRLGQPVLSACAS